MPRPSAGQRQILTEQIGQLDSQIEGLQAQEQATLDQRRLIEDELADVGSLVEQGLELMPRLRSLERARADLDGRSASSAARSPRPSRRSARPACR